MNKPPRRDGAATVLIADDHQLMRSGVRDLLEDMGGMEVVAEADDGLSVISAARRTQPDLAIVDIKMPNANGVDAFVELRRWSPATKIVVLTGITAQGLFVELMDAGVDGLFLKHGAPDELANGLRRVLAGERVFAAEVERLVEQARHLNLTRREMQVLQAIARGETNTQMAERLHLSPKTVDTHRTNLMRKLDANSAPVLLSKALQAGLIGHPDGG